MSDGKALIFSAPSGSGKTTLVKYLLSKNSHLAFSISACTRPMRVNYEVHGKDYYFLSPKDFKNRINKNEFIEWEEVYQGSYYGTLKSEVERIWSKGQTVVFDVDVKGGVRLKEYFGNQALAVFVRPPGIDVLRKRLIERGTESAKSLAKRIEKAEYELGFEDKFDLTIVNDVLEDSSSEAIRIVDEFLN